MMYMEAYERPLAENFKKELSKIAKVKAYCPPEDYPQTSTVSFTVEGVHPNKVATLLANKAICVWDGDFYATQFTKVLGLRESGGFVRVGLAPYNTEEELDRTLAVIRSL